MLAPKQQKSGGHRPKKNEPEKRPFILQRKGENNFQYDEAGKIIGNAPLQPKLQVGKADDSFEKEADSVADQVVSKSETPNVEAAAAPPIQTMKVGPGDLAQRENIQKMEKGSDDQEEVQLSEKGADEQEEVQLKSDSAEVQTKADTATVEGSKTDSKAIDPVQRKSIGDAQSLSKGVEMKPSNTPTPRVQLKPESSAEENLQMKEDEESTEEVSKVQMKSKSADAGEDVSSKIQSAKGGGAPMEDSIKSEMESGFGHDFSDVRIHSGSGSSEMNQSLGAKAFTTGKDIFFNEGEYQPESKDGKHLLAHELTHTLQQGGGKNYQLRKNPEKRGRDFIQFGKGLIRDLKKEGASKSQLMNMHFLLERYKSEFKSPTKAINWELAGGLEEFKRQVVTDKVRSQIESELNSLVSNYPNYENDLYEFTNWLDIEMSAMAIRPVEKIPSLVSDRRELEPTLTPEYGSDIEIKEPLDVAQMYRYNWFEVMETFKAAHPGVELGYLEPWARKQLMLGWKLGEAIPLLNLFRAEYGEKREYEVTGELVPTLYVYYYGELGTTKGNFSDVRNELVRGRKYDGFWVYVNSITGAQSILHQRNSVTKFYMSQSITNLDISNVYLYLESKELSWDHSLEEMFSAGLDSSIFRKAVETVQFHLFGKRARNYGLYTKETKIALEEAIKEEIIKRDKARQEEVFKNDYETLPSLSKTGQATVDKLLTDKALIVHNAYKEYKNATFGLGSAHATGHSHANDLREKFEELATKHLGSPDNYHKLKDHMILTFQRRANQIARVVLKNTAKLINDELASYENDWKLQDLANKLVNAKSNYGSSLYERYEGDKWAEMEEQMEANPYKGMHNPHDYEASRKGQAASNSVRSIASMGHPMMEFFGQSRNVHHMGRLLGMYYSHPNTPQIDLNIDFNPQKSQPQKKEVEQIPPYSKWANQMRADSLAASDTIRGVPKPVIPLLTKSSVPQDPEGNPYSQYSPYANLGVEYGFTEPKKVDPPSIYGVKGALSSAGDEIKSNIYKTLYNLKKEPHKVWELDNVVAMTMIEMGLDESNAAYKIIKDELGRVHRAKAMWDMFMAVVNIGLGILMVSGIGTPFAVLAGLGAASISIAQYFEHKADYDFQRAAANTGFSPEQSLSSVEPTDLWLFLDLMGIGMDVFAAFGVIARMGKLSGTFKAASAADQTALKPKFMLELDYAVRSEVKNLSAANEFVTKFGTKLDDPKYLESLRTEASTAKLNKLDEVEKSIAKIDADKVRIAEQRTQVNEFLNKLFGVEPGVLRMSLLPKGEKLLKIATDTYFAASNGFKSFQKFLLELEKKGLIKSIKALQASDRALLESIYNQGKTLHKSDPEKLAELKKAYEAGDLTKMEEILDLKKVLSAENAIKSKKLKDFFGEEKFKKLTVPDPDNPNRSLGSILEEIEQGAAAQNGQLIDNIVDRAAANTGADFVTSSGKFIDVKRASLDLIRSPKSINKLVGKLKADKNLIIALDVRHIDDLDLQKIINTFKDSGVEKQIIVIDKQFFL